MAENRRPLPNVQYALPYTITSDASGYIVFGVMFGGLTVLGVATALKTRSDWGTTLIPLAILIGIYVWLCAYRIILFDDRLTYRTLFSEREISFSEVAKAVWLKMTGPPLRVRFYFLNSDKPVTVNAKLMSRRDLGIFVDVLTKNIHKLESETVRSLRQLR